MSVSQQYVDALIAAVVKLHRLECGENVGK